MDCIDDFKTGECGCGCLPCGCKVVGTRIEPAPCSCGRSDGGCCCNGRKVIVKDSKGSCTPVQPDPFKLYNPHRCNVPGGDMTIKAPIYALTVENPPDDVLRDENGAPILVNGVAVRA